MSHELLKAVVQAQKAGQARGIPSICSSHPEVLRTALRRAARTGSPVLIESTCNQVNQFGGYTGLTPTEMTALVHQMADQEKLSPDRLHLGGDHLGPFPWQGEPARQAMGKAVELVQAYVRAGYTKIHLDASMKLGGDNPNEPLEAELCAQRTAALAKAAECACSPLDDTSPPCYVIGSEVPPPGGRQSGEGKAHITEVEDLRRMLQLMQATFHQEGLEAAWERVLAVVVQPGIEFGHEFVQAYDPDRAADLVEFIEAQPALVYEAHSTDYQTRAALKKLVANHFAILKVGPALTFAYREAVFALAHLEAELVPAQECSRLIETLETAMLRDQRAWQAHYHGAPREQALARKYSLSDRVRYYWPDPQVQTSLGKLLRNLSRQPLPLTLLSQFLPHQYERLREGCLARTPQAIIHDHIEAVLENYAFACRE
jgi:D-tagatose-1,6-bisphosphate aldolase subunit GatZ/KbaZ